MEFTRYRNLIIHTIKGILQNQKTEFAKINDWAAVWTDMMSGFIENGKMLRGSLVLFAVESYGGSINKDILTIASAIEISHSSLLVHDDIMDNDGMRRGKATIHVQFASIARDRKYQEVERFGQSMGICMGDFGIFLASRLLSEISHPQSHNIQNMYLRIMQEVGLAQMQDVDFGHSVNRASMKEIEQVYLYKTARYTCSLPLMLGSLYMSQENELGKLEMLGEAMGMMFQLSDDALGLFGDTALTGKPVGSDIRENKQTLYRYHLYKKAAPQDRQKLDRVFGRSDISESEVDLVRNLIKQYKIDKIIVSQIGRYRKKAENSIFQLAISDQYKVKLRQLLSFISDRNK